MSDSGFKHFLIGALFILLAGISFGIFWFLFLGPASPVGLGWYLFSFAAGLTMIVLPCTLPLAFVIVPLSMGKGAFKGFMIALFFGLGVAITLSFYGVLAAVLGKVAIGSLGAPLEVVKNWLYFIAGIFAYLFALGELGLVNFRMPSYSGAFPAFIQKQQDVLKALLLGLFLGNIGVGCPHPATPVILTRIAASGDIFYGWLLFFIHAVGRVLPLIFLAILGILGVNALSGLVKHKEKIERATGWGMVFVAGFILILGLFSHDWWVLSGQHTILEEITQEERLVSVIAGRLGVKPPHEHGLPPADHTGLFGLPLSWGTWVLLFLWILPFWWRFSRRKKEIDVLPEAERTHARQDLRSLFWNFITLSVLLVVVFGYLLPQRFLTRAQMPHEEMMGAEMGGTMAHEGGHGAILHEEGEIKEGIAVNLNFTPPLPEVNNPVKLDFFVNMKPGNIPVSEGGLEIQHEKKMHVIGVRNDLNEFRHIHPEPELPSGNTVQGSPEPYSESSGSGHPGLWTIKHTFRKPGEYKVWSEIKYQSENHVFGHPIFTVGGSGPTFELQKEITTNRVVERYQVGIDYHDLAVGAENHIDFLIRDFEGRKVELDDYLEEKMHLSVISEDLTHFIHTHPSGHNDPMEDHSLNVVERALANGALPHEKAASEDHIPFMVSLPEKGFYKVFGQFRPKEMNLPPDTALHAEFWIEVRKVAPRAGTLLASWWGLLIISLILIAVLSWGVRKYITVSAAPKKQ